MARKPSRSRESCLQNQNLSQRPVVASSSVVSSTSPTLTHSCRTSTHGFTTLGRLHQGVCWEVKQDWEPPLPLRYVLRAQQSISKALFKHANQTITRILCRRRSLKKGRRAMSLARIKLRRIGKSNRSLCQHNGKRNPTNSNSSSTFRSMKPRLL